MTGTHPPKAPPGAKNPVEWVMFAVGCALTAGTIALLVYQAVVDDERGAPAIVVRLGQPEPRAGRFAVPVRVENRGDETAEAVQVEVTLSTPDGEERTEFEIGFLPGHGTRKGAVTFETDPRLGTLRARPLGYETP